MTVAEQITQIRDEMQLAVRFANQVNGDMSAVFVTKWADQLSALVVRLSSPQRETAKEDGYEHLADIVYDHTKGTIRYEKPQSSTLSLSAPPGWQAIETVVKKWRRLVEQYERGAGKGHADYARGVRDCAEQLAALIPAPPGLPT